MSDFRGAGPSPASAAPVALTSSCPRDPARLASGIKRRSFSLLLARRYLNPRRSVLSSFTLISLVGVTLGVLVLVVVMAVYAGMERDVKSRFLGFSPHVLIQPPPGGFGQTGAMEDWQAVAAEARKIPQVRSATPFVSDSVLADADHWPDPYMFTMVGVDAEDKSQVENIDAMLNRDEFPGSTADLGLDDRVVIASTLATNYGIGVGDTIRLYSTGNLRNIMRVYKATENPPLREAHAEAWRRTDRLAEAWQPQDGSFGVPIGILAEVYEGLLDVLDKNIREAERAMLDELLNRMEEGRRDDEAGVYSFAAEEKAEIDALIRRIETSDPAKMDDEAYKELKTIALPKEAVVAGVYQASMMSATPDIFAPLPLAVHLAGLETGTVEGISLRLDEPYDAPEVAVAARQALGGGWHVVPWNEQPHFVQFSMLIDQQRVMMYFSLSFIMLVAAFSMMANIFTVTIQKRREIGVMKALGAAPGQIVRVFIYQGMLLGLLGAVLGVTGGRVVVHFRGAIQVFLRQFGFDPFSATITGFNVIPAHNNPVEQLLIGLMAFALCTLAALVPAFVAARSDAAKSLRNL